MGHPKYVTSLAPVLGHCATQKAFLKPVQLCWRGLEDTTELLIVHIRMLFG